MGLRTRQHDHARHRNEPGGRPDRGKAASGLRACAARWLISFALASLAAATQAEALRIATYHVELSRKGPGLLLRDILKGEDAQVAAVVDVLAEVRPDILYLSDIDFDLTHRTLTALQALMKAKGIDLPHVYAPAQNVGVDSGADLDGDGRIRTADDAHGFGFFSGDGGTALLSRWPIDADAARDFSTLLWRDLPGALLTDEAAPQAARGFQRLSSTGHWIVPVDTPEGQLTVLTFYAGPPVFDGPEDRNGRRNHDEVAFWQHFLDGAFGSPPQGPFVLLGNANLDPEDGDGRQEAIRALLADPRLQDPAPADPAAAAEANAAHKGDPATDTANWDDPAPGNLRVDYVLPSAELRVLDSGTIWPRPGSRAADASRHAIVWVDLVWPPER